MEDVLLNLFADDRDIVLYRPTLNKLTGSVTATLLLQQIIYRYVCNDYTAFYKFKGPCSHKMYKAGDSWTEELGFSKHELSTALSKIAVKINASNRDNPPEALVYYRVTPDRLTYYWVNTDLLVEKLRRIYVTPDSGSTKGGNPVIPKTGLREPKNGNYDIPPDPDSQSTKSESTDPPINTESTLKDIDSLIVREALKDQSFIKVFNDFCIEDSTKYREHTLYWIMHNANNYGASLGDIIFALEQCVEKDKQGKMDYYTGIIRRRTANREAGIAPAGAPKWRRVEEYLKERLSHQSDIIKHWTVKHSDATLTYVLYERNDRHAVQELMDHAILPDLERETGVQLQAIVRL